MGLRQALKGIIKKTLWQKMSHRILGGNFIRIRFVWGDLWKKWHHTNYNSMPEKLNILKKGLNEKSQEIIDNIIERYMFITPLQKYSKFYACNRDLFFNSIEKAQQQDINKNYSVLSVKKKFPLPLEYYPSAIFYYDDGMVFIPKEIQETVRGKDVIDGGAWIGDSALVFTKYNPKRVFAFEPVEYNYNLLQKTIVLNHAQSTIIPVKKGLGKGNSAVEVFGILTDASMRSEVLEINTDAESQQKSVIQLTSIDLFVAENNLNPGLIKLDIEGNEMDALEGAVNTIKNFTPLLIISIYHTPNEFFGAKPLIESLNLGYKFEVKRLDPFHPTTETVLIAYPSDEAQVSQGFSLEGTGEKRYEV